LNIDLLLGYCSSFGMKIRSRSRFGINALIAVLSFFQLQADAGEFLFGTSVEEKKNFEELTSAKWLTCSFEPIESNSGEIFEGIYLDRDSIQALTKPAEKSEIMKDFRDFQEAQEGTDEGRIIINDFYFYPMTLIFDSRKSKVQLLFPLNSITKEIENVDSTVVVQDLDFVVAGALQIYMLVQLSNGTLPVSVTITSSKTDKQEFLGVISFNMAVGILVMSARCSPEVPGDLRPAANEMYRKLEDSE
jgi:hypothetical protein